MTRSRSLGHRAPLLWLALPFAAGLILAKLSPAPWPAALTLTVGLVTALVAWRAPSRGVSAAALVIALVAGGAVYFDLRRARVADYDHLPSREARLTLRLERAFGGIEDPRRFSGIARVVDAPAHLEDLRGQRVQVSLRTFPPQQAPERGATVIVTGLLTPLPRRPPADGGFEAYLIDQGINFRYTRAGLDEVVAPPGPKARAFNHALAWCRARLGQGLDHRPELVATLRAMLLGQRQELSADQRLLFLRSGTMHLFAISGLHIGAIALALHGLLQALRMPRRIGFILGAALLWGYVELVGAPPSAVRAFLMVTCVQAAFVWRRPGNALAGLALSAVLVLAWRPMDLFSAGFQMSYGIVSALLLFGLPLGEAWQRRWPPWPHLPRATWRRWHRAWAGLHTKTQSAVGLAASATLVSAVTSPLFFNWFTPGAFVINLIFIPLAVAVVWAGFLALLAALVGFTGWTLLMVHAGGLIVATMQASLELIAPVPGLAWAVEPRGAWWGGLALLGLLGLMGAGYARDWSGRYGGYWPPVIWVALMLVTGLRFV
jgi:competence protein ComEC